MGTYGSGGHFIEHISSSDGDLPSACPACRSSSIVTTVKKPDVDTYWRCAKCGEVWNVARRRRWGRDR
jgi:transposase-like protein